MRFFSFLVTVFPFLADSAAEADAAIGQELDDINQRITDGEARIGQGFADLGARIQALEVHTGIQAPVEPPGPVEPPPAPDLGASTMAPTPAGMAWLVIPDTAQPQPGEVPGTRCAGFTPVPRVIPAGFVLALVPASEAVPSPA